LSYQYDEADFVSRSMQSSSTTCSTFIASERHGAQFIKIHYPRYSQARKNCFNLNHEIPVTQAGNPLLFGCCELEIHRLLFSHTLKPLHI